MASDIDGFTQQQVTVNGISLSFHMAGTGAPLILLHGFPQNHMTWAPVAPTFANRFQVIVPDLRGYGDSDAPPDDVAHETYSKRTMAQDVIGLMVHLGLPSAHILGHDRGARVAYRLALDHPGRVRRLGIIEIVPTGDFWNAWHADLAMAAYHWTFLAQPAPLPERMIGADSDAYIDHTLKSWTRGKSLDVFAPNALNSYRRQARDPAHLAAMCADYRAGATTDRALDMADKAAGKQITAPLRFLYARSGFPARTGDPAAAWRDWAPHVETAACDSGHFVIEENPNAVIESFLPFFDVD